MEATSGFKRSPRTGAPLEAYLAAFFGAYNFAKRLKTLHGLTPFEPVRAVWTTDRDRFKIDPTHLTAGLNI